MLMGMCMKETGEMTRQTDMELILMPAEPNMLVLGRMIYRVDTEKSPGQTVANTRVSIQMVKSMEKGPTTGLMVHPI